MSTVGQLVPDPIVRKEFGITAQTNWRWDRDPRKAELGWPPAIQIGKRNYRSRALLEAFKENLMQLALKRRAGKAA